MPITFAELVQEVINEVRAKEQAYELVQKQHARIQELEAQLKEAAEAAAEHKCPEIETTVRDPDKKPILQPLKEVKKDG